MYSRILLLRYTVVKGGESVVGITDVIRTVLNSVTLEQILSCSRLKTMLPFTVNYGDEHV